MNEKKIILTEEQLDEALRFASMGGAGILSPNDIKDTLEKLPEEIAKKALSSAMAAGILRKEAFDSSHSHEVLQNYPCRDGEIK